MSNKYNNSKHDAEVQNQTNEAANDVGELRNGRKSQIKNSNPSGDGPMNNEYISELENNRDHD